MLAIYSNIEKSGGIQVNEASICHISEAKVDTSVECLLKVKQRQYKD